MEDYQEDFEKEHHRQKHSFIKNIGICVVVVLVVVVGLYLEFVQVRGRPVLINGKVLDQHYRENEKSLAPEIYFSIELDDGDLVLVRTNTLIKFQQGKMAKLRLSKSYLLGRPRYDFVDYVK